MHLAVVKHTINEMFMQLWVVNQEKMCRITHLNGSPKDMVKDYTPVNN